MRLLPALTLLLLAIAAPAAMAAPPPNDNLAQATPITALPAEVAGTVAESTRETGEPGHAGRQRNGGVWYAFTPTQTTSVIARTCEAQFDTVLAVYTGAGVGALSRVTDNDDSCATGSIATWTAMAGTTYFISVSPFQTLPSADEARFTLRLAVLTAPANDAFADALRLSGPRRVRGSNVVATSELGEPEHFGGGGHSVWFRYRARRTQTLTFDTLGSTFDTVLAIYRGDLGRLRRITRDDDGGPGLTSRIRLRVRRGSTYFIALDGTDEETGDWEFGLSDGGVRGSGLRVFVEPGQTLDGVVANGLRTRVSCVARCRLDFHVKVGAATARRLGLGRRPVIVARLMGTVGGDERPELPAVLRLSRAARSALRDEDRVTLTLVARLRGTDSRDRSLVQKLTLG